MKYNFLSLIFHDFVNIVILIILIEKTYIKFAFFCIFEFKPIFICYDYNGVNW